MGGYGDDVERDKRLVKTSPVVGVFFYICLN